jgi:hypothetical protein
MLIFVSSEEKLRAIASYLNLVPPVEREKEENWYRLDIDFLRELLVHIKRENVEKIANNAGFTSLRLTPNAESMHFNFRYRGTSVGHHSSRN